MTQQPEPKGHSFFEVLGRRWLTACLTFAIVACGAVIFVTVYHMKFAAIAHVLLVNDQAGRDPSAAGVDMPTIVASTTVLEDVKRKLHLNYSIPQLRKAIVARVAPKSSIMTIIAQDHDARIAVDLPNAVADSFVDIYSKLSYSRYDEVTRRLQNDLQSKRETVFRLERQLEAASSGASYVGSQTSLDAGAAHLADLTESRGVALGLLVGDRAALRLDRGEPGTLSGVVRHEILMNNAAYRESELEVGKDVAGYTTSRAGVRDDFPGMAGYRDKIDKEADALATMRDKALALPDAYSPSHAGQVVATDKAAAAVSGDEAHLKDLDSQIATAKSALLVSSQGGTSIGALRAERDATEAQFQALALRVSAAEANSAESSSLGQVVVVDRALRPEPTLLKTPLLLLLGLVAAAALACVAAYLAELLIPRLLGPSDVERVYGQPTLTTLRSSR